MQNLRLPLAAASVAALVILGACHREPTVIEVGPPDTQAEDLAKAKPVQLPPSIVASKAYRCKDNSLVYVDFMSDQKSAVLRMKKGGEATPLSATEPGKPFAGNGYSVSGSGSTITLTAPGKGAQACTA